MSLLHADLVRLCDAGTCAEVPRADHKLTTAQIVEVRLGGKLRWPPFLPKRGSWEVMGRS